jgi:hypothetical protein
MSRSLLALLMILLAAPACAGSRFGVGFHGFHGGGFPAFHRRGGLVLGFFGGYLCGYSCSLGFYNPAYGYFNGYGYLYGSGYGNSYFNGYGYFNRDGYFNGYGNGDGYGYGEENAASISNGLTGGYVPYPVGADIPPLETGPQSGQQKVCSRL